MMVELVNNGPMAVALEVSNHDSLSNITHPQYVTYSNSSRHLVGVKNPRNNNYLIFVP